MGASEFPRMTMALTYGKTYFSKALGWPEGCILLENADIKYIL